MLSHYPDRLRIRMTSNIGSHPALARISRSHIYCTNGRSFHPHSIFFTLPKQVFPLIAPSTSTLRLTISGDQSTICLPDSASSILHPTVSCMSVSPPRAPLALVRLTVQFRSSFDRFFVLIKCTLADDWRIMGTLYVLG